MIVVVFEILARGRDEGSFRLASASLKWVSNVGGSHDLREFREFRKLRLNESFWMARVN